MPAVNFEVCGSPEEVEICWALEQAAFAAQEMPCPPRELLDKRFEGGRVLVAKVEGQVAGFYSYDVHPYRPLAMVIHLVVNPDYRRLGVGTGLCEYAWTRYREIGVTKVIATAAVKDADITAFHEARGNTFAGVTTTEDGLELNQIVRGEE